MYNCNQLHKPRLTRCSIIQYIMLENKVIKILPLEENHLEALRKLRNNPQIWRYLTTVLPIDPKSQRNWFEKLDTDKSRKYFAIEKGGEFVGIVRTDEWDQVNQSVRVGVDILPNHQRQGIATRAYNLLFDYFFNQVNLNRVWLLVAEFNTPALNLYRKLGFQKEGVQRQALYRDGKRHDYIMMSLLREEHQKP